MHHIVILDGYTENPGDLSWSPFEAFGTVTVYDRTPAAEIVPRLRGADIVITNKTPLQRETFDACPDIRYIGVVATGYDVVDVQAARERGIPVTNVPAYGTAAVGQFAIALLLEICFHVAHHAQAVRDGRWQNCPDFCFWDYPLIDLAGKTLGVIGLGRIGRQTAQIARAMGMHVLAYARHPHAEDASLVEHVSLDELYARSDVISLHCPLFPETRGMICKESIAKMKDGVILINNARGPLIVEQDLADALNSGKVYAAGLDVVSSEPIRADNPLLHAKNCLITPPHQLGFSGLPPAHHGHRGGQPGKLAGRPAGQCCQPLICGCILPPVCALGAVSPLLSRARAGKFRRAIAFVRILSYNGFIEDGPPIRPGCRQALLLFRHERKKGGYARMDLHKIDPQSWKQDLPASAKKTAEFTPAAAQSAPTRVFPAITAAMPKRAARPACCACACPAAA